MNEELTTEVLEAIVNCDGECIGCPVQSVCDAVGIKRSLATALLEERAKPKVWGGAPDNAFRSIVNWYDKSRGFIKSKVFTRELPKTRARIIAEEIVDELDSLPRHNTDIEVIESILTKYAEELTKKETN